MKTTVVKIYPNGTELHTDGSFRNMPRVKSHDKQQDSLLDAPEMGQESRSLMAKILDERLKDKTLWK